MAQNFTAKVDGWVLKSKQALEAVFKEAVQSTIEDMQTPVGGGGNMPVDTGFLRASLDVTLNTPTLRQVPNPGSGSFVFETASTFIIAGADIGDTIYATYGANYAKYQEYGANGKPGRGFVRLAAMNWQENINKAVARLSAR